MSEKWEYSSDFNGNLGLAERLVNIIIALFLCPICIVSKDSNPNAHELPFFVCARTAKPPPDPGRARWMNCPG